MIKSAVFDIGGTLMEYKGMPCVWVSGVAQREMSTRTLEASIS